MFAPQVSVLFTHSLTSKKRRVFFKTSSRERISLRKSGKSSLIENNRLYTHAIYRKEIKRENCNFISVISNQYKQLLLYIYSIIHRDSNCQYLNLVVSHVITYPDATKQTKTSGKHFAHEHYMHGFLFHFLHRVKLLLFFEAEV